MTKFFSLLTLFLWFNVFVAFPVHAQEVCSTDEFCNPLAFDDLWTFLQKILEVVITIAFPIIILFLVYAGFLFLTAQGSEEKIKTAKRILLWSVIGALLILGAQALSLAIQGTIEDIESGGTSSPSGPYLPPGPTP